MVTVWPATDWERCSEPAIFGSTPAGIVSFMMARKPAKKSAMSPGQGIRPALRVPGSVL